MKNKKDSISIFVGVISLMLINEYVDSPGFFIESLLGQIVSDTLRYDKNFETLDQYVNIEEEGIVIEEFTEPPMPVGGFHTLQKKIEIKGIEDSCILSTRIIVAAFINKNGDVKETRILKSAGSQIDKSVIHAIKNVEWLPAKFEDKEIETWISIPIDIDFRRW